MARRSAASHRKVRTSVVTPTVVFDAPALARRTRGNGLCLEARRTAPEPCFYVDRQGRQHFNFPQRVWLAPAVPMAYTRVPTTALETLAVNLLTLVTRKRDYTAAVGRTTRRAIALAPQFMRDCLLDAPEEAWVLPRAAIRSWVESRIGRRRIARRYSRGV